MCFLMFFSFTVFAGNLYYDSAQTQLGAYQQFQQAGFFIYGDWLSIDVVTEPLVGSILSFVNTEPDYEYTLESSFFFEFDYVPDVNIHLLQLVHSTTTYSVYSEGAAQFEVKYVDTFLEQSQGYPKLAIYSAGVFYSSPTLNYDSISNSYKAIDNLPRGEYTYEYITTNSEYMPLLGEYCVSGTWYVTSRPYGFELIRPKNGETTLPENTNFAWNVFSDEGLLYYDIYLGTRSSKDGLAKIHSGYGDPKEYTKSGLEHTRQYYWYMVITNKHGASIETDLYTFYTGGRVQKFYNAPNPFNPARGQQTQFVFNMPQDGTAKLVIYSEYGDKVYESRTESFQGGADVSKSIFYDGRDNSGKMLYNGTYIAILTKKYGGQTKVEKCRILVIK